MGGNKNLIDLRFRAYFLAVFFFVATNSHETHAQSVQRDSLNKKRLTVLLIGTTAAYSATMIGLNQVWYSSLDKQPFSFFDDSREWFQLDKAGHAFSTFQLTEFGALSLQWAGMQKKKSITISALTSFLMVSSIELFDGYSSGYGASASDLVANAVGSTLSFGQHLLWDEIRIRPKFSFHQTNLAPLRPSLLGNNLGQEIIKDYNGQTYWLSADMDKFITFPKWLNLALGYGGHDMVYANKANGISNGYSPYQQLYLSLDLDLSHIRTKSKGIKTLLYFVNMIKLPSPTLEFSQGKLKTHVFYF